MQAEPAGWLADRRVRFILSGLWNSFFSWIAFAACWWAIGERAGLWAAVVPAHLLATTQAFFLQRWFVFRALHGAWAPQYLRFQFASLLMLGLGGGLLSVLQARGLHPLVAQVAVIVLLAACSYVVGRDFTFSTDDFSMGVGWSRMATTIQSNAAAWAMVVTLSVAGATALAYFDTPSLCAVHCPGLEAGIAAIRWDGIAAAIGEPPLHAMGSIGFFTSAQFLAALAGRGELGLRLDILVQAMLAFWLAGAHARACGWALPGRLASGASAWVATMGLATAGTSAYAAPALMLAVAMVGRFATRLHAWPAGALIAVAAGLWLQSGAPASWLLLPLAWLAGAMAAKVPGTSLAAAGLAATALLAGTYLPASAWLTLPAAAVTVATVSLMAWAWLLGHLRRPG